MEKEVITVFTAKKARRLLKDGYEIVDIKPDKLDPSGKKTLFIFKNENGIFERIRSNRLWVYGLNCLLLIQLSSTYKSDKLPLK